MVRQTITIDEHGAAVLPKELRERFHIEQGTRLTAEETPDGILLRPKPFQGERWTAERKAEFLLNSAVGGEDYARTRRTVREDFGLDPDTIPHTKPGEC